MSARVILIVVCLIMLAWVAGTSVVYAYRRDWPRLRRFLFRWHRGFVGRSKRPLGRAGAGRACADPRLTKPRARTECADLFLEWRRVSIIDGENVTQQEPRMTLAPGPTTCAANERPNETSTDWRQ
jgi:hypothetical protein